MKAVIETLHISPAVYVLRVVYIVLHACLPVVSALVFVANDALFLDPLSYFFIGLSVISVLFFLSMQFISLPKTVGGMALLFVFPVLFIVLSQLVVNQRLITNLAELASQELLSVTLLGVFLWWYEHKQPATVDNTLQGFVGVLIVANLLSIAALATSAYRIQHSEGGTTSTLLIGVTLVYMLVSAVFEARAASRGVTRGVTSG